MRHVPTLEFIHDALPETARHLDDLLAKARESDAAVAAASAGARRTPARPTPTGSRTTEDDDTRRQTSDEPDRA